MCRLPTVHIHRSLGELFLEFKRSYERVFHTLKRVRVGLPMSHDTLAGEPVCCRVGIVLQLRTWRSPRAKLQPWPCRLRT